MSGPIGDDVPKPATGLRRPNILDSHSVWSKPCPSSVTIVVPGTTPSQVISLMEAALTAKGFSEGPSKMPRAKHSIVHPSHIALSGGFVAEAGLRYDHLRTFHRAKVYFAIIGIVFGALAVLFYPGGTFSAVFVGLVAALMTVFVLSAFDSYLVTVKYEGRAAPGTHGDAAWDTPTSLTVTIGAARLESHNGFTNKSSGAGRYVTALRPDPRVAAWPEQFAASLRASAQPPGKLSLDPNLAA